MISIAHDIRHGWRLMVRRPTSTIVAVLALGIGIGANLTVFSWLDTMVRQPLHGVAHADRFVALNGTTGTRRDLAVSYPDVLGFREHRPAAIEDVIAYSLVPLNMRTDDNPQRVWGQLVTGNFFDVLEVRALLGRTFLPEEDSTPGGHPVVVLSHRFWQRQFHGDLAIVNRTLMFNGRAFTVIGVAAPGFLGTEAYLSIDAWVPMTMQPTVMPGSNRLIARDHRWLESMVKLKPGARIVRAQADLDVVAGALAAAYSEDAGHGVALYELWRAPTRGGGAVAGAMGLQMAVASVVLLIACANVANLLLVRAAGRQRETAVRLALGATRGRLARQLLTESALLAGAGGLAGTLIAYWTADLLTGFVPPTSIPIDLSPSPGGSVLVCACVLTALTVMASGLVPALRGSASSVLSALKESASPVTASPRRALLRQALVAVQVALSFMLLVCAGLFLHTLRNAQQVDPGFAVRHGVLASIDLLPLGYDDTRGREFFRRVLSRVRALPAVDAVSLAQRAPFGFGGMGEFSVAVDGYTPAPNEAMVVSYNRVGSDYLTTLGIPVVSGREFTDRDDGGTEDVTIINETLARLYFLGRDPVGGRVRSGGRTLRVVGVARDARYASITEAPRPLLYLPVLQWYRPDTVLHVKTAADPAVIVPMIQHAVRLIEPNLSLSDIRTIAQQLDTAVFVQRTVASLLGIFGLLALGLATVGLYGVIAASVALRTPEIGLRMALGASRRDIMAMILRQGLGMTSVGLAVGIVSALALTRLFATLLIGVSATDGPTLAGTAALMALVAAAATYLPARRAAAVDPLVALRNE